MRVYALYLAILFYALFSSPSPDSIGMAEWLVIACLGVAFINGQSLSNILNPSLPSPLGFQRVFVLWMMSVPLVIGVFNGYLATDIIRDIVPVVLLALPILCLNMKALLFKDLLTIAGFIFALRYILMTLPDIMHIGLYSASDSLLYLANSPLVPFAAIMGFSWFCEPSKVFLTKRVLGFIIFTVTIVAMALMAQRAPLLISLVACSALTALRLFNAPMKTVLFISLLVIVLVPFAPFIHQINDGFINKTIAVGGNNRVEEFITALHQPTLFGHGWGMEWQSPAVGDYWVRYTHNMVSYYWLKAGIIGAVLCVIFIYVWLKSIISITGHNIATGMAILVPILIHFFLYTGYKTFDLSLLLTLVILCKSDHHQSSS